MSTEIKMWQERTCDNPMQAEITDLRVEVARLAKINSALCRIHNERINDSARYEETIADLRAALEKKPAVPTFEEWCKTNWDATPTANARDAYNERVLGGKS